MRSARTLDISKDLPFREAVTDPDTRAIYIRREYKFLITLSLVNIQILDLQLLQWWTEAFVNVITQSTKKMPYSMRYLARETLEALRVRFCPIQPKPLIDFI